MLLHIAAHKPSQDASFLPQWLAITLVAIFGVGLLGSAIRATADPSPQEVVGEVANHIASADELKRGG